MSDFTLPFQQTATKLNGDGTAFEVDCQVVGAAAIAGKVSNSVFQTGVYGELGGPFPQNLVPIKSKATANPPAARAQGLVGPGFLNGAVVGQTNLQDGIAVLGASQYGIGVDALSDSGTGVQAGSNSGVGVLATSNTQDAINGTSSAPGHAGVSANNNNGGYGLWAKSWGSKPGTGGIAGYFDSDGNFAIQAVGTADVDAVNVTSGSAHHAAVSGTNNGGGFGVWANSPNGTAIYGQGKTAGHFQGDVEVTGDVKLIGADCAEHFDVVDASVCDPGTVMVIDDSGALVPSSQEYDRRVAGVVSGAGDFRPGLILDQKADSTERRPIALVGKVYCKADATYGAIEIGDLLTTSPTSGHAMKANDPSRSFGAVLGKALRPLRSGKGLVPILIALQ